MPRRNLLTLAMRRGAGVALAALVGGCATIGTPTVTDVAGKGTWAARIDRPLFRDAVLTVTDPASGQTFTGKLPGTAPTVAVSTGTAPAWQGQHAHKGTAFALLRGDRGGALTCELALGSDSGMCTDAAGGSIYLAW